jgi:hypothetical protein
MMLLRERMDLVSCLPRSMAKLRGKAQLHFRCLEGVRPFLSRFYRFIGGPESVYEWDLDAMSCGSSFRGYQLLAKQMQRCGRWNPRQYTFNGPRGSPLSMKIWLWPRVTLRFTVLH